MKPLQCQGVNYKSQFKQPERSNSNLPAALTTLFDDTTERGTVLIKGLLQFSHSLKFRRLLPRQSPAVLK